MPRIFLFSPTYLRTLQIMNFNVFINLCIALFIFLFLFTREQGLNISLYLFVLLFAGLAVAIRYLMIQLRIRRQMVLISDKGLFKKEGSTLVRLDYRKILTIHVWEDRQGKIAAVHFLTNRGKIKLQGFEGMDNMLELIRPYVEDLVVIHRKRLFTCRQNILFHALFYVIAAIISLLYMFVPFFHTLLDYFIWFIPVFIFWFGWLLIQTWRKT